MDFQGRVFTVFKIDLYYNLQTSKGFKIITVLAKTISEHIAALPTFQNVNNLCRLSICLGIVTVKIVQMTKNYF